MRPAATPIWTAWNQGGPFVGDAAPHSRVTVEKDWSLHLAQHAGTYDRCPIRWYQRCDNSQVETEVPNIKSIDIDRNLDTDAASATITLYNQKMLANAVAGSSDDDAGQPGYYTWRHTTSRQVARWGARGGAEWRHVLIPDALLRTYQGYGGNSLTIPEAVAAGNLVVSGVWMVDSVRLGTDGTIELKCRDMAKLLIDQQVYPPLVPSRWYPHGLRFCRWNWEVEQRTDTTTSEAEGGSNKRCVYAQVGVSKPSASDVWYGSNASVHGHRPSDAFDNNPDTFWLSVGNNSPEEPYAVEWIEAASGDWIDTVGVYPWSGNYRCFGGETRVLTREGTRAIKDLAGTRPTLLTQGPTGTPKWVEAPVRSFGSQRLMKVNLTRNGVRKTIRATAEHRWILRKYKGKNLATMDRITSELQSGDRLQSVLPPHCAATTPSSEGIAAGLVFGDGTVDRQGARIKLFGACRGLVDHFGPNALASSHREPEGEREGPLGPLVSNGEEYTLLTGLPFFYKRRPALDENSRYLLGWLAGYFAADGSVDENGCVTLSSGDCDDLLFARDVANRLGIGTYAPTTGTRKDGSLYWHLRFMPGTLREGFFLLERDRQRWLARGGEARTERRWWTVESVEESDDYEEVYCAVVPETHTFVLEDHILTGNCYISVMEGGVWVDAGLGSIAYDPAGVGLYTGNNTAIIPYVAQTGIPKDTAVDIKLPRAYKADKVRITLTNLVSSPWGPYPFRAGVREITLKLGQSHTVTSSHTYSVEVQKDGNYLDYTQIVAHFALWAGFFCYEPSDPNGNLEPHLYGNIELTGIADTGGCVLEDQFDKKPVIDAMHLIRDIVGFLIWIDEEGGFHFESPNWFRDGNHLPDGTYTNYVPTIDEAMQLTQYTVEFSDRPVRSEIIISSAEPTAGLSDTVTTRRTSTAGRDLLRGMSKPMMLINEMLTDRAEQAIMAHRIEEKIVYAAFSGSTTCAANPCIGPNDQVIIHERVTGETGIHYVSAMRSTHDLDSGSYLMTLTTFWLGDETGFDVNNPVWVD